MSSSPSHSFFGNQRGGTFLGLVIGLLVGLAVAFVVTPWLARIWMKSVHGHANDSTTPFRQGLQRFFKGIFHPFLK